MTSARDVAFRGRPSARTSGFIRNGPTARYRIHRFDRICREHGYILIGMHSWMLEGEPMTMLCERGWKLEIERSAISTLKDGNPVTYIDGVQGWINPGRAGRTGAITRTEVHLG